MNLTPTTILPQLEDDQKALLQRALYALTRKVSAVALASAARPATTQSADIDATGFRAVIFYLNVTAVSGTGGLQFTLRGRDPISGNFVWLGRTIANTTTTTSLAFCAGLGVGAVSGVTGGQGGNIGVPLPDTIRIEVTHGDTSSYTYSVGYCLVP